MRFSIICTNYNKEPYIEKCITSVLEQSFTDYEFIIIDDASTDNSISIIKNYQQKEPGKIKFIQNEKNIGMAAGYNKAIPVAKGDLVCLIDSDDFWFPDKLKVVDEYFKTDEACVMHQHPLQVYHFAEKTNEIFRQYLYCGDMVQYMKDTKKIPLFSVTTGLTFKTAVVKNVLPVPVSFSKNGEAFLTRTVTCFGTVGATYKVLGGYRKTDTNVVFGNKNWDDFEYIENILKPALNAFYQKNGIDVYFPPGVRPGAHTNQTLAGRIYRKLSNLFN